MDQDLKGMECSRRLQRCVSEGPLQGSNVNESGALAQAARSILSKERNQQSMLEDGFCCDGWDAVVFLHSYSTADEIDV